MGGRPSKHPSSSSYEPFQCCPSKPAKSSKVAKIQPKLPSPKSVPKKVANKPPVQAKKPEPVPQKPLTKVSKANHEVKGREKQSKPVQPSVKEKTNAGKPKKGFFGTGKYIWWW